MGKIYFLLFLFLSSSILQAQDFSNKGKDFWVGYGYHQVMTNGNQQEMVLYFATDQVTTVTVSIPSNGYTQTYANIPANTVFTSNPIPKSGVQDARLLTESAAGENKGIHIVADKSIVAYAHIYNSNVSGASILFPTSTLGKEYYSINYTNQSNTNNSNCWAYVIAADTGTTKVEITPVVATLGHAAGVPFIVSLTQGQVYNVMATFNNTSRFGGDLTGTKLRSISSGSGGCKRIAVYSGSGRINITCDGNSSSSDNYMVQAFPKSAWGKNYLTCHTGNNLSRNIYRICVSDPAAIVRVNGVTLNAATLVGNFYYVIQATAINQEITSDLPICVAQYITSQGACGNGSPGDPEVIYLSPVEQNIAKVTWNATPNFAITTHFYNVVIPNTGTAISSFTLDGNPVSPASFTVHPQDNNYSYLIANVGSGPHTIQSDSGFNAIAYGYGSAESYGYNAGTNVVDLYQRVYVSSLYGIEPTPTVCVGSPFKFKISLPYEVDSIKWNFTNLPGPPSPTIVVTNSLADSSTVVNGKTLYWYSVPTFYTFNQLGVYPITITTYSPDLEGCGTQQYIDFDLTVVANPVTDFTFNNANCVAETYQFTDNTNTSRPNYRWYWNFGDPASGAANIATIRNPTHVFSGPGTYNVKYGSINTAGCISDTLTRQVVVAAMPTATITGSTAVCINTTPPLITFTATGGTAPFTFTYNLNSGPVQSITTTVGNTVTITAPTTTIGSNTYNLLSVQSNSSALCQQPQTGSVTVTVRTQPTGVIAGGNTVCLNAPSPSITFTGATGTSPYNFFYTLNGGPVQTVSTTSGNSVSVSVPTTTAGTFNYTLTRVEDANGPLCGLDQSSTIAVVVKPLPTATIAGAISVCRNATFPNVTFTGASGSAPYTFSYNINGGAAQTITTTTGNSVTVPAPTTTVGTFTYNLLSVREGSANTCTQSLSGSVVVIVNPLPTAVIAGTASVCLNGAPPSITFTGAGSPPPYTFTYNINGGISQTITTITGNSVSLPAPTNVAGSYVYNLVSVKEATGTLCSQSQNGSATIIISPLPTATIAGNTAVCKNASSPLVTLTGNGGTAPYTFTYSLNGGPVQTISTTSGNSVTIAVPTSVTGTFTYNLLNISEGGSLACAQAQTGSVSVTVNGLPLATISGTNEVCRNAASPLIIFTGSGTMAPYTFTYNINGGPSQTVTSTSGNSVAVAAPTGTAGTFIYNLVAVKDASPTLCSQAQTGSVTVLINPLPVAAFATQVPSCNAGTVSFTDNSVANAGTLNEWQWDFGDPASGAAQNTSNLQNPVHYYANAGSYNVTLIVKTTKGCASAVSTQAVIVNSRPKAGFINPQVCLSDTYASFTDTSTVSGSTITAWQWNFDDPASGALNTSTLQNPQHSYNTVGTKNAKLIVTSAAGCRDTTIQSFMVNGDIPVAGFMVTNAGWLCANDTIAITNTSTVNVGSIIKIEIYWDNAGAPATFETFLNPASGDVYKHKYPTVTTTRNYTIRYRVYSGLTCINDKFQVVSVNAAPAVVFSPMPPGCLNISPFQVTQARETGGVAGTGVFTGPGISATGIFDPLAVGAGTYRILYTYTSNFGCKDTASQPITVLPAPVADFTRNAPACEKNAVTFTQNSTSAAGTLTTWTWNFGDGTPVVVRNTGTAFPHTFASAGTYTVTLVVTTSDGCKSLPKTLAIIVSPSPHPNFTFTASACLPQANIVFTNTSAIADGSENTFTYSWNFGDGSPLTSAKNPSHVYTTQGPFSVKLSVTSGAGCVKDTTIVVNTIHPAPLATFDFSMPSICVNGSVNFIDRSNGLDGTLTNWEWMFGDGGMSRIQAPSHTFSTAGTYLVKLAVTNSFGCISDTFSKSFTVYPYPLVDAGPDLYVLEGGSTEIEAMVTGNGLSYLWTPATELNNPLTLRPIATPTQDRRYLITATAQGGCSDTSSMFIKVLKGPQVPNTFTPNNDGINDFWIIEYLDTYPNNRVQVFSRTGQLVFESRGYRKPWDGNIKGKSLPVDTYYYIIEPGNGRKPLTGYVTIVK